MQAASQLVCDPRAAGLLAPQGLVGCAQALDKRWERESGGCMAGASAVPWGGGLGKLRAQGHGAAEPTGEGRGSAPAWWGCLAPAALASVCSWATSCLQGAGKLAGDGSAWVCTPLRCAAWSSPASAWADLPTAGLRRLRLESSRLGLVPSGTVAGVRCAGTLGEAWPPASRGP